MKKNYIALGIYQELSTADSVISRLKKRGLFTFATIHNKKDSRLEIKRYFPISYLGIPFIGLFSIAMLIAAKQFLFVDMTLLALLISLTTILSVIGFYAYFYFPRLLDINIINVFKDRVLINEIFIFVQVDQPDVRDTLAILRQVESGHPVTFLLRPETFKAPDVEISLEPLTMDQLKDKASTLASSLQEVTKGASDNTLLVKSFKKTSRLLQLLRQDMADAEFIEQSLPSSAEWFLDNMYVLEGSIEDVWVNLPKKYYKVLPKLADGPLKGYPRIYVLAMELIKFTAGQLHRENIVAFLESNQMDYPLTIGELWAFPLMLRLRLIEWVEFLAIRVDNRMREGEFADFWGNRLLYAARHDPGKLPGFLEDLTNVQLQLSSHFAEELLDHLFDEETVLPMVRKWAEDRYDLPLSEILHQEHVAETSEQVVFSNAIKSLIALSQISWLEIFETVSPVDAVFRKDPDGIYSKMDFRTRNSYRERVEELARRMRLSEVAVAKKTLSLARNGATEYEKHIGYYLIDVGRQVLENLLGYRPRTMQTLQRWVIRNGTKVYLGGVAFGALTLVSMSLGFLAQTGAGIAEMGLFLLLLLLPISELAVQFVNFSLSLLLPTQLRPKMLFKEAIPLEYKSLVVVPTMLLSSESIKDEVDRLEIRYLANADPHLCFGLFTDFPDASQESTEDDALLLVEAIINMKALEEKYGEGIFFLFHRKRVWSEGENVWMGWERKRGKLEYLNRFLMGEQLPERIVYFGNPEVLKGIRYVITLDSDTQLPKDQAKAMVEILAHPLNKPYLNSEKNGLERGFTIIQPRVITDFIHSKASYFSKIFSEPSAVDPYTQAISNVYQDLFGESTYHGKGIYDVAAFHTILNHHFPEHHLLSHDLIEGAFARVGFACNVCLYDIFPKDFLTATKRQHRWMRGDWQIIDWLFPTVPTGEGTIEKNPLSVMNRWKIFDNLRRAFLPAGLLALLITGWFVSSIPELWTGLVAVVLVIPCIYLFVNKFFSYSFSVIKAAMIELKTLILRCLITISVLPYEAYNSIDAALRVAFRRLVSHRHLLQWTVSADGCLGLSDAHQYFLLKLIGVSLLGLGTYLAVYFLSPQAELIALPFCLLWLSAPLVVKEVDKPLDSSANGSLSHGDSLLLRKMARKTWRYFDELVGPKTNWLPPDNYQTSLNVEVAQRTSPTNTGMWLLTVLSAYDFRFITCDTFIDRIAATVQTLNKLERYEGHFLNWYNIETLDPLFPRYVSTVDSGNLLASLWLLKQGIMEATSHPIFPEDPLSGIRDTFDIFNDAHIEDVCEELHPLLFHVPVNTLSHFITAVKQASVAVERVLSRLKNSDPYWIKQVDEQLNQWVVLIQRYLSWVEVLSSLSKKELKLIDAQAHEWKDQALGWKPSLEDLAMGKWAPSLESLMASARKKDLPEEIQAWSKKFQEALSLTQWYAGEEFGKAEELIREIDKFSDEMNLKFLYNSDRKLFVIGYNVDDKRLDSSFYDLLASEARLASIVAIAKEDVPLEHWWALGRLYSLVDGRKVLLSWGGTMFEYLMPLIFHKYYKDSLLGEACDAAVECQIAYGQTRGIPWGISESAFSAIDSHKIYQYKSFGIPGLGLKRGLENDLVISPYSTALALAVSPKSALANLKRMESHTGLMGEYGFYESMDFTRQRSPKGERGVVVYVYMAHHQGMVLTSINNTLNKDILINRFQKDPRICGVNSLFYERIPISTTLKLQGIRKEPVLRRLEPFSESPIMGVVETPESVAPKVALLSNESYSLMISNSGGGYARWGDIEIYRWRADTTRDCWGAFYYIKDLKLGKVWSSAYQPTQVVGNEYSVNFKADKAEFKRKDYEIETITEIVVSPEDNAEIRLITLINHSAETRSLELTSYLEVVLAPHLTDRSHPCFNKLFIETEAFPESSALMAFRRLRSPEDRPLYAVHILSSSEESEEPLQYETDRAKFIGRGNTLKYPAAVDNDLSGSTGTVLDPIFSLRRRCNLGPGKRVYFSFVTAITDNRDAAMALIEKYKNLAASQRAIELAWTYAQLELRYLRIHQDDVQLFQKLASRVLYPQVQLRTVEDRICKNRLSQSSLWAQGISGDYPIVTVTISDTYDVELVKQLLIAHTFLSLRGLKMDLVILNEEEAGYEQPLNENLRNLIQAYAYLNQPDTPGGVFLRSAEQLPKEEFNLILAVSSAVLVASRGSLRQQLVSPKARWKLPPKLRINERAREEPSRPLPFLELPYFNGLGGFSEDGRSYVTYLGPNTNTPAPWINVIANPQFGVLVSEAGLGCTWYGNSQTNRLTPWSNDPLLNPIADVIYLRDEELGTVWTPTSGPIRELDAYRVSHSQGYSIFEHNSHGIGQELLVFVPMDDNGGLPLRIQRLRLTNHTNRKRKLTATAYSELILGSDKEATQMHIVSEWDSESQSLLGFNHYNSDFGGYVAFSYSTIAVSSYTADRTEFIGRNKSTATPEAMARDSLSGHTGGALDPCSALQVDIVIEPGQQVEVSFILGYAPGVSEARQLVLKSNQAEMIEELFTTTKNWWDWTLETIQVEIPDKATMFLINRWLVYQDLSCRFWGRSAFYQSSGAYGFRDQLQDTMTIVYSQPKVARDYILKAASRQFVEGDVQHWWHPQTGAGIRTRCSDDLLWLPFVVAHYVRVTGDLTILDERVPFLEGDALVEGQDEVFQVPTISKESESLLEHCRRAVKKGTTAGPHGLPLIGSCDWNDGMNRVGIKGKGESVWLGWFLAQVMNDFAELLSVSAGNEESGSGFKAEAKRLAEVVESTAWDGAWYRRAYFDDGTPIGSKQNLEASIDSLTQSWAVISGLANLARALQALKSAEEHLVLHEKHVVLLLTPPFDKTPLDPGYIKGYPPGVRENGGQYTHGSSWLAMAHARLGDGNKAAELLRMMSPTLHTRTQEANSLYRVEPYVIAADIYNLQNQVGRGGWTWYTGSASWVYRIWLEEILGFKLRGQTLSIECVIPKEWDGFKIRYRYKSSRYLIEVKNPEHISKGKARVTLDKVVLGTPEIPLVDDGADHIVEILLSTG